MTKSDLIRYLKKHGADAGLIAWIEAQHTFGPEILFDIEDIDWLEQLLEAIDADSYENRIKPLNDHYVSKTEPIRRESAIKFDREHKRHMAKMKQLEIEWHSLAGPIWREYDSKVDPFLRELLTWDKIEKAVATSSVGV